MKNDKICTYCGDIFTPRRRNHKYCSPSCKTQASIKRNNYKYVSGHFERSDEVVKAENESKIQPAVVDEKLANISSKLDKISNDNDKGNINTNSVVNSAIGTATSDALLHAGRRIFAPETLPATKGDINIIRNDILTLKKMIVQAISRR